jgi:guanylate kinase
VSVPPETQRGQLLVISAPSGAGKTTLVRRLMERRPDLRFSVSHTTRPARRGEREGHDYFFVDRTAFEEMRAAGGFLEHAEVFGYHYGTGREQVEALLAAGHDVLLEIDWQGARQVRANLPECRSVMILPPSLAELKQRLHGRSTDSEAVIRRRLGEAMGDMSHWQEFDHVIINDDLEQAVDQLQAVAEGRGLPTDATTRASIEHLLRAPD